MDILDKLLGGIVKVRALRLFLLNPTDIFGVAEVANRIQAKQKDVRKEISLFEKIGLVKKRMTTYEKKKVSGYVIDPAFEYLKQLTTFITQARSMSDKEMVRKLARAGKIKMVVLSGLFLDKDENSRLDLLIVGEGLRPKALTNAVATIEADVGRELTYASFEIADFKYRMSVYDKLVRDTFDYPHIVIYDRL